MCIEYKNTGVIPLAAAVLLVLLAGSCSTTSGSTYSSSVYHEAAAATAARQAEEAKKKDQGVPPPQNGPSASRGDYGPNPGYGPGSPGGIIFNLVVEAARVATSGTLSVEGLPGGVLLYVDGMANSATSILLPAGRHMLRAEGFGWLPWTGAVDINMGIITSVVVSLQRASLSISRVSVDPSALDPEAPGSLRSARIRFRASAPCAATVEVQDQWGVTLASLGRLDVQGPDTVLAWDGPTAGGRALRPGAYRVVVKASDSAGASAVAYGQVTVTPGRSSATYSSLAGGFSGALYAPDARILPGGRFQAGIGGYAVVDPSDSSAARLPVFGGFRLGFPGGKAELSGSAMAVTYPGYDFADSPDWAAGSLSIKASLGSGRYSALALLVGGSYGRYLIADALPDWDGPARYPGVSAGLVLESDSELARIFGSAQLEASSYYPGWLGGPAAVPGFFTWAYLRAGIELLFPDFLGSQATFALSAAGRSAPFATGLSFTLPLSIGAELHWYAPDSPTVISIYGSGEWADSNDWYLGAGLGLGFLL